MLTPQDVSEKRFDKVLVGGYNMPAVDEFLETLSADYNALYKENAILKGKLKVLVEKVEEYRSTEDAMRMALLTAQRMGEEITVEAARTKEEMLKSADEEVKAKLSEISQKIAAEELRLVAASKETAKFLELSQAIIRKHSEFLKKLEAANRVVPDAPVAATPKTAASAKSAGTQKAAVSKPVADTAPAKETKPAQDAQPAADIKPAAGVKPVAGVKPAAPKKTAESATAPAMPAPAPSPEIAAKAAAEKAPVNIEFDDIVSEIGSAVEEMTSETSGSTPKTAPGNASETSGPLFDGIGDTIELPATEENEDTLDEDTIDITPRPKFDFDDLKFGANFDTDD